MVLIDPTTIPLIDFARLETDFEGVANEIKDIAATWGFLYIKNTGIQQEQIDRMFEIADVFFNKTSPEEKASTPWGSIENAGYDDRRARKQEKRNYEEYGQNEVTKKDDPKESFAFRKTNSYDQPLPPTLKKVNNEIQGFMRTAHEKVALKVLACLSVSLGLPADYFPKLHNFDSPSFTTLRLLHYPGLTGDDAATPVRLPAHTDHTVVTVLFQHKVMGLQVRPPNLTGEVLEGEQWLDAPIIPGAVLVNIGETMTFLSGGLMKSTLHRVARSPRAEDQGKERFSCVYFCHANEDTKLAMVEGIQGGVKKTPPISCVTGKRVETVKDWIQHRHSRGTALALEREEAAAKQLQAEAGLAITAAA
ncbi:hypothetical protein AYL99_08931 [Fonsecaea erecta]|uniref:Fe2OG dioxygenase domain-containing protein n=1 Tax=Fonsecaea erecta TaxID=1367422 RepID=A0A178ZAM1_9EURO|nr:hypothetical protein AYL99_08931 [Fonsecaea erecta]OAP56819.1 hypothetical protein AYL99_08931 [Fonsecaea erecta]